MMHPKTLYQFPQCAGKSFRPSNGTEGMIFYESFCYQCRHQHPSPEHDLQCRDILLLTLLYETNDVEYPKEWIFSDDGWPICTKWEKWDWSKDDDGNWIEPIGPIPDNPNQLVMPFGIMEYFEFGKDLLVTPIAVIEKSDII